MSNQQPTIEKKIIHINKSFGNVEIQRITFKGFIYTQANSRKYGEFGEDKHLVQEFGYWPNISVPSGISPGPGTFYNDIEQFGANNEPVFLVQIIPELKSGGDEHNPDDYNYWILPETVEKTVVINPGNYTVSALAQEFEIQLNGQQEVNDTFSNFLLQEQKNRKGFGGNFFDNKWILGKRNYLSIFPNSTTDYTYKTIGQFLVGLVPNVEAPNPGYCFLDGVSFQKVVEDGRNTGTLNDINSLIMFDVLNKNETGYVYYGLYQETKVGDLQTMPYNIYGASEFQLLYDTETINRFSITNLHTPLKVPNYSDYNTTNPNAGQQITKFDARELNGDPANNQQGYYPLEVSSGVVMLSFDYEKVKSTTTYLDNVGVLSENINDIIKDAGKTKSYFIMNTYRHFDYYDNDEDVTASFEGGFWDRLGFTEQQLYNFESNIETYQRLAPGDLQTLVSYKMWGIITHNDSGYSMATSAGGLGAGLKTNDGTMFQPFSTFGVFSNVPEDYTTRPNTEFNILTTSKYLTAEKYPDLLAGKNYYIIKSNIIQNKKITILLKVILFKIITMMLKVINPQSLVSLILTLLVMIQYLAQKE
jgi:hypothetical protein